MKIAITGCNGRMGQVLVRQIALKPELQLAGGSVREGSPHSGVDVGTLCLTRPLQVLASSDLAEICAQADAVIDFTRPEYTEQLAPLAAKHGAALVVGTTGLEAAQQHALDAAARSVPVLQAANMSIGVNLLLGLVENVARTLDADYDIEIVEMHHRHKVDAPSGTALALGQAAAAGRAVQLQQVAQKTRDGITGPRTKGAIGFATLRGGDVVGDHTVMFAGLGERIELSHKASNRDVFASGAIRAAQWLVGKKPGHYTMRDVLGL